MKHSKVVAYKAPFFIDFSLTLNLQHSDTM